MSFDDDSELAARVQRGDRNAFETLLSRYERPIHAFVFHFFRDPSLCQDLTQETFLRAWRFIGTFRTEEKFSTWLYAIARNLCVDEVRRLPKGGMVDIDTVDPEQFVSEPDCATDPLRAAVLAQEGDAMRSAVARLPERYRTCIILFYFNELSYDEISAVMKISLSNTKIMLFRGKRMLLDLYRRGTSGRV